MCLGGWFAATRVPVRTELLDLLPEGPTATQRLLLRQLRTGVTGRLILMALEGADADRLAEISKQLAEWMRKSGLFYYVGNGVETWTKEERDYLFRSRYLLSPDIQKDTFAPDHLRDALQQRLDDLRSPLAPMIKEFIPADPTAEFLKILSTWTPWSIPTKHRGVWFSVDRQRALLVAETKAAGFDVDAQERVHQRVREAFQSIVGSSTGPLHLVMTGPGVFTVEAQQTIQNEIWWLSLVAAILVFTFLYLSYRSFTLLVLSLVPLASGIVAGIIAVDFAFGFIHGITLGFGITLLGVVDDYPIHLFSHLTGEGSASNVMQAIWPTMRLGVITTALGFSALLLAGFPGLSQLGLFAIVGLLTAAATTRWVLPFLVPVGFCPRRSGTGLAGLADQLTRARLVVPVSVLLAIAVLIWSNTPLWEQDIANLSPISSKKKMLDQTLRAELGAPDLLDFIVIEGSTEEEVLQRSEDVTPALDRLVRQEVFTGFDIVTRYVPSRRTQAMRQAALPDQQTVQHNLRVALKGLPFRPTLFQPFVEAIQKSKTQAFLESQTFRATALGLKVDSLLFERSGGWVAVAPLRGITDRDRLHEVVTAWGKPSISYLDLKGESNRSVMAYRNETLTVVGWGTLAIGFVLFIGLRSPSTVLRVMIPIGSAIVVVGALLHSFGERLSLFHVASFLLVMGLGLDYALFFNRRHGTETERDRTVYGLLVCSTTTILVFGVLACSQLPVLKAIGMTAALGSFICLLFAALLADQGAREA